MHRTRGLRDSTAAQRVRTLDYRQHPLAATLRAELHELGLVADEVFVYSSNGCYWSAALRISGRPFVLGVNHREGLFCWATSPGAERNLIPPATTPVFGDARELRRGALRLVKHALRHPEFAFGEPQVV
jgi:hypothetical protein